MSDGRATRVLGGYASSLSLAVRPVDGFTDAGIADAVRVRIEGRDATPIETPSGHLVFLDLEAGTETLVVDGGSEYVSTRVPNVEVLDLSDSGTNVDPGDPSTLPLETVALSPSPAYRFPPGTTLLRGFVTAPGGDPLGSAAVSATGTTAETHTTADGEYVLYFDPITDGDVARIDGTAVVQANGSSPELTVQHPDHGTTTVSLEDDDGDSIVVEGATTRQDVGFQ